MCDRPADKAVRSPWTEGAWLVRESTVPEGWQWRYDPDTKWFPDEPNPFRGSWIVEARPTPQEDQ